MYNLEPGQELRDAILEIQVNAALAGHDLLKFRLIEQLKLRAIGMTRTRIKDKSP